MLERLSKSDEGKKLYDAARKAAKAASGDDLEIRLEPAERLPGNEAAMDPRNGVVGIPDHATDASMLEDLLVELSNMAKADDFVDLQFKQIKKLKRDEYIDAMEKLEFASVQRAAKIWKAAAKACGQDPSKMPEYGNPDDVLKLDFNTFFKDKDAKRSHKAVYGDQWDAANPRKN
jgi:hypothetical protein